MPEPGPYTLSSTFLRLRPDASIEPLDVDASFWQRLVDGQLGSFHNEYLVNCHEFDSDWTMWEMHPAGDEIVCLLSGAVTFLLERESGTETVELQACGDFAIVPQGTWHTARVNTPARVLFITAGENTQHRHID